MIRTICVFDCIMNENLQIYHQFENEMKIDRKNLVNSGAYDTKYDANDGIRAHDLLYKAEKMTNAKLPLITPIRNTNTQ